jgi:serine/threonine-protein kinase RsbW
MISSSAHPSESPQPSPMRLVATAQPEAAGAARLAVAQFARSLGARRALVTDISLAVTEAVTNVVVHAYRERSSAGEVTVTADRQADILRIVVRDDGVGLAAPSHSAGLGLGLGLIAGVAESLELRDRESGGAEVCMRFSLAG